MNEHDYEPIPGLPAPLPPGETILWQGSPDWRILARRAMRVRLVAGYFLSWSYGESAADYRLDMPAMDIALSTLRLLALGTIAVALLVLFAWLVGRTTVYTITTRRVVMRFGIALPITIQISFPMIDSAAAHIWSGGAGDIAITLLPGQRIAYLVLWPHARPWKLGKAQPSLRAIPDAGAVAQILGRALAASASQPAKTVTTSVR